MKFHKKLAALAIIVILLASALPVYAKETKSGSATASASSSTTAIKVQYNGKSFALNPSPRLCSDGDILVPLRDLCAELKVTPQWIKNELYIERNGVKNKVPLGNKYKVINDTFCVQISTLSQPLNCQISFDSDNNTIILIDYQYFMNQLKTKAPIFNAYLMHDYDPVNTAEFKESLDFSYKMVPYTNSAETTSPLSQTYDIKGNANITGKMSENSASCSGVIQLNGIENTPIYKELGNKNTITFDFIASDKNFYFKSNLLEKEVGSKWMQGNFSMLEQDGVASFKDLKNQQFSGLNSDLFSEITNTEGTADINTFNEINSYFSAMLFLVDNNHFNYTTVGNETLYTWKLDKTDLVKLVTDFSKLSGDSEDLSLSEALEMKKFLDSLEFDLNMTIKIKDNHPNSENLTFNFKMDVPNAAQIEMKMFGQSELFNINTPIPEITPPPASEVIDMTDGQVFKASPIPLNAMLLPYPAQVSFLKQRI